MPFRKNIDTKIADECKRLSEENIILFSEFGLAEKVPTEDKNFKTKFLAWLLTQEPAIPPTNPPLEKADSRTIYEMVYPPVGKGDAKKQIGKIYSRIIAGMRIESGQTAALTDEQYRAHKKYLKKFVKPLKIIT